MTSAANAKIIARIIERSAADYHIAFTAGFVTQVRPAAGLIEHASGKVDGSRTAVANSGFQWRGKSTAGDVKRSFCSAIISNSQVFIVIIARNRIERNSSASLSKSAFGIVS